MAIAVCIGTGCKAEADRLFLQEASLMTHSHHQVCPTPHLDTESPRSAGLNHSLFIILPYSIGLILNCFNGLSVPDPNPVLLYHVTTAICTEGGKEAAGD